MSEEDTSSSLSYEGETHEESPPLSEEEALIVSLVDIIKTYDVARDFSKKIEERVKDAYNRLYQIGQHVVASNELEAEQVKNFLKITREAEDKWMGQTQGDNPAARKKGKWLYRTFLPVSWSSAKTTVRKGIEVGAVDVGKHIGKTKLAKLTTNKQKAPPIIKSLEDEWLEASEKQLTLTKSMTKEILAGTKDSVLRVKGAYIQYIDAMESDIARLKQAITNTTPK